MKKRQFRLMNPVRGRVNDRERNVGPTGDRRRPAMRFGALLAEGQVVFAATAFVGVAFGGQADGLVQRQELAVRSHPQRCVRAGVPTPVRRCVL